MRPRATRRARRNDDDHCLSSVGLDDILLLLMIVWFERGVVGRGLFVIIFLSSCFCMGLVDMMEHQNGVRGVLPG